MLETLRSFAVEKLADAGSVDVVRARHADYFRGLAARQRERLWGPAEPDAWRVLDDEWSNFRSALDTYEAAGDLDSGAELVVSLAGYAAMSMRFELFSWAKELLALPGVEDHPQYTDLCGAAALGSYFTLDDRVTEWAEAGLAANPSDPEGLCRCSLAAVFLNNVHAPEASDALTSTWLASDPQSTFGRVWAHGFRTFHLALLGEAAEAARQAAAVSQIADESGSLTAKALAAWANGQAQSFVDLDLGMETWRQGIEFCRSLPRDHLIDQMLVGAMLHLTARRGELSTTLVECRDALRSALAQHYYTGTSHLFGVTAIALTRAGDAPTGARLIGSMIKHGHLPRRNARRELESALGDDLDDLLVIGSSLSITQAGRVAIEALDHALERVEEEDW